MRLFVYKNSKTLQRIPRLVDGQNEYPKLSPNIKKIVITFLTNFTKLLTLIESIWSFNFY